MVQPRSSKMNLPLFSFSLIFIPRMTIQRSGFSFEKCKQSYYADQWTSKGVVPQKLSKIPHAPLYMRYNGKTVFPGEIVATEDMFRPPKMKWNSEPGALYTIMVNDFGIERLQGAQYFHWMVSNVPDAYSINSGIGDEVREYIPPFYFKVNPSSPPSLDFTQGNQGHDMLFLVFKQTWGRINMADEVQTGCNSGLVSKRIGDYAQLAEKYNLELVAGNFLYTTYTEATNTLLCYYNKCTGEPLPFLIPGINDGPRCQPGSQA